MIRQLEMIIKWWYSYFHRDMTWYKSYVAVWAADQSLQVSYSWDRQVQLWNLPCLRATSGTSFSNHHWDVNGKHQIPPETTLFFDFFKAAKKGDTRWASQNPPTWLKKLGTAYPQSRADATRMIQNGYGSEWFPSQKGWSNPKLPILRATPGISPRLQRYFAEVSPSGGWCPRCSTTTELLPVSGGPRVNEETTTSKTQPMCQLNPFWNFCSNIHVFMILQATNFLDSETSTQNEVVIWDQCCSFLFYLLCPGTCSGGWSKQIWSPLDSLHHVEKAFFGHEDVHCSILNPYTAYASIADPFYLHDSFQCFSMIMKELTFPFIWVYLGIRYIYIIHQSP